MSCARHADAILDHALGEPASADLQAHLGACDACRASLERERRLVGRIDGELHATLDVAPSPEFLPRVRAGASAERERRPVSPWRFLVPVAALAATLAIVAWLRPSAQAPRAPQAAPVARAEPRREGPVPSALIDTPRPAPTVVVTKPIAPRLPRHAEPEVIVPPGEEELLRRYAIAVRAHRIEALPVGVENARSQELVVPLLPQIAPLEVKSLADVNSEGVDHE